MSLKLNKLADAAIQEDVANNRERVARFQSAEPSSPVRSDPVRYSRRLSDAALELGLELYQQEGDVSEIRRSLATAGKELFAVLALDQENAVLTSLEFERALALAVCFWPHPPYADVAGLPMTKFFPDAESLAFYAVLARYLDLLRRFLNSGQLENDAWDKVAAECTRGNASRYDAQVTRAKLNALKALATGDGALLNGSIATLIDDHENEAKRGENQRSSRGFVCLPALMFAQLGASRDLPCTVKSPYLPLLLLQP